MVKGKLWRDAGKLYNVELASPDPDGRKVFMVAAFDPVEAIAIVKDRWMDKWNPDRVSGPECVSVIQIHDLVLSRP